MPGFKSIRSCAIYSCFFLSGAAALVYELLWVRSMSLFLGHSQWAIATVVASFMAGLALGGWLGGRAADAVARRRLPAVYALLEAGIAVYGLCFQPLTAAAQKAALSAGLMSGPHWLQAAVWFVTGFALVLIPTVLMGATFPVFVRWLAGLRGGLGRTAGLVYWVNTAGAVCGVFAAGFYLIGDLGMRASFQLAAGVNLLCALLAVGISRLPAEEAGPEPEKKPSPALAGFMEMTQEQAAVYTLLFISGFAALISQIAWTRALVLVIGSSTYAFTVILGVFLLGLSLGGGLAGYVFKKTCPGWGGISIAALSAAGCLLFSLSLQNYLPYLLVRLYPLYFNSVLPLPAIHLFMAMLTMFVPTVCMGFLFPALLGAGNGPGPVEGRTVGRYTAVNTLGAIAGVLVSGFVLIPVIGIELTLCITVLLYLLAALTALYVSREPWRKAGFILAPALVGAALFFYPKWEPGLLSSGTFFYSGEFRNVRDFSGFREHTRRYEVLMYKDGASSTVTVLQNRAGIKFLRVNGKTDASNAKKDMATQLLLAYLPMALFPGDPQNALVVGLGSGVSAGALAQMPGMQRVDCVEIEPEVARAASFFSEINHGVLEQPQFNLILTDARHLLTGSKQTYDLIVSEPSNPWMSGIASLYTKEAFELVKSRLSGNGLFCQWIHGYAMSEADFKLVLNTFASVFPDMMLFTPAGSDYLIIGSQRRIETDYKRVGDAIAASPAMARDLRLIGLGHPFAFLAATFIFDDKAAREYAAGAPVHTDDRMTLEFSAPRSLLKNSGLRVEESLRMAKKKLLPERIANFYPNAGQIAGLYNIAGEAAMDLTGSSMAEPFFYKVLGAFPDDAAALTGLGRNAAASGDGFKAEWFFKKATALKTSFAPAYLRLSELYADRGENSKALDCLERGLKRFPGNPELTSALRTKRSLKRSQPPF